MFTGNNGYGLNNVANSTWLDYSLFYGNSNKWWNAAVTDGGHTSTNQDLRYDIRSSDFRLTQISPAYNSGANLSSQGVTMDILGVPRPQKNIYDRGAYELVLPPAGTVFLMR